MIFPDASRELEFEGLRRRRKKLDKLVVHWTAAEGSAQRVHKTLKRRGLSVDFIVDWDGKLYLCNPDPLKYLTWHAGNANAYSVGVEVVNYGYRHNAKDVKPHPVVQKFRPVQVQTIHGRQFYVADFFPAQLKTLRRLVWGVEYYLGIPTEFPTKEGTNQIVDTVFDWQSFAGVIGHYHVSPRKVDPGTAVLQYLRDSLKGNAC